MRLAFVGGDGEADGEDAKENEALIQAVSSPIRASIEREPACENRTLSFATRPTRLCSVGGRGHHTYT